MRIFRIKHDSNNIQAVQPIDSDKINLDFMNFDCEPRSKDWQSLMVYIYNPKIKPKNFYRMGTGNLVFDEKTLETCATIFEMTGEILPLQVERGEKLYLLNILQCMNGLNYETSQWAYYKDGTKGRIIKYGFHPERVLNESSIFKIPETSKTDIFCWADVKNPDDEFYHLYHNCNLTGLIFEELYNSEKELGNEQ